MVQVHVTNVESEERKQYLVDAEKQRLNIAALLGISEGRVRFQEPVYIILPTVDHISVTGRIDV